MFWFFTHYEDKGKLGCPTLPEEKVAKSTFLPLQSLQSSLEHRSKIFLPEKCQFSSKHPAMTSRGGEM